MLSTRALFKFLRLACCLLDELRFGHTGQDWDVCWCDVGSRTAETLAGEGDSDTAHGGEEKLLIFSIRILLIHIPFPKKKLTKEMKSSTSSAPYDLLITIRTYARNETKSHERNR